MDDEDVCRICRGEATEDDPLCHPCGCSGSIKYVHQECIQEWLKNSRVNTKCDLCGVEYTIGKIYDQKMPDKLPFSDYIETLSNNWKKYATFVLKFIRALVIIFVLLESAGYSMEFVATVITMEDITDISGACRKMKARAKQSPPPESIAPLVDWFLGFVLKPSMWRTVMIHGIITICTMVGAFLVLWTLFLWISDEPIVVREANRVRDGVPSLLDMGDYQGLQDIVNDSTDDIPVLAHLPEDLAMRVRNNPDYRDYLRRVAAREQMFAVNIVEEDENGNVIRRQPRRVPNQVFRDLYRDTEIDSDDFDPVDAIDAEEAAIDGDEPAFRMALYESVIDWFGGDMRNTALKLGAIMSLTQSGLFVCIFFPLYSFALYFSLLYRLVLNLLRMAGSPALVSAYQRFTPSRPTTLWGNFGAYILEVLFMFSLWRFYCMVKMKKLLTSDSGRELLILNYKLSATLKSAVVVAIELLAFPVFCGCLLHLISIPLLPPFSWHEDMYRKHPFATTFFQWCIGLAYLRATMMLVICLRKCFRNDVLYFVHEAKTIDLIRHIIVTPIRTQVISLGTSLLIHGLSVFVGLGSFNLMILIAKWWDVHFTINVIPEFYTVLKLWPMILMAKLYTCKLDQGTGSFCAIIKLWAKDRIWLIATDYTSRILDLDSWFFAQYRPLTDEEIEHLGRKDKSLGYFVRAPATTKHSKVVGKKMFTPVDQFDDRLDGQVGVLDDEIKEYVLVWRPTHFWLRMSLMFVAIWAVIIMLFAIVSIVPYYAGKIINTLVYHGEMKNDLLILSYGLCVMFPVYGELLILSPPFYLSISKRFNKLAGSVPSPKVSDKDKAVKTVFVYCYLYFFTHSPKLWNLFSIENTICNFAVNILSVYIGSMYWSLLVKRNPTVDFITFHAVAELLGIIPGEYSIGHILRFVVCLYHVVRFVKNRNLPNRIDSYIRESKYSLGQILYDYEPPAREPVAEPTTGETSSTSSE